VLSCRVPALPAISSRGAFSPGNAACRGEQVLLLVSALTPRHYDGPARQTQQSARQGERSHAPAGRGGLPWRDRADRGMSSRRFLQQMHGDMGRTVAAAPLVPRGQVGLALNGHAGLRPSGCISGPACLAARRAPGLGLEDRAGRDADAPHRRSLPGRATARPRVRRHQSGRAAVPAGDGGKTPCTRTGPARWAAEQPSGRITVASVGVQTGRVRQASRWNHRCTQMHTDGPESGMGVQGRTQPTAHGEQRCRAGPGPSVCIGVHRWFHVLACLGACRILPQGVSHRAMRQRPHAPEQVALCGKDPMHLNQPRCAARAHAPEQATLCGKTPCT
jgi:hypothetical protein